MNVIIWTTLVMANWVSCQRSSPCPDVLKYEPREKDADRWYALITLQSPEELDGVWVHIKLDRKADVLVNWFGESSTNNNEDFLIKNEEYSLPVGKILSLKIAVKYNLVNIIPSITRIRLNGGLVCSYDETEPVKAAETHPPTREPKVTHLPVEIGPVTVQTLMRHSSEEICGTVPIIGRPLVYNGQQADEGQWPWHLAVALIEGEKLIYSCGGSLISKTHAVTAAHCATKFQTKVRLEVHSFLLYIGTNNLRNFGPGAQVLQVSEVIVHPEYNFKYYYNDIAILKMSRSVEFTDYVRPICLWEGDTGLDKLIGKPGTVVGWGVDASNQTTQTLNEAKMPIVSLDTCIYSDRDFYSQFTSEKTYCAGYKNGTTVCRGDSGGGMVFRKEGTSGRNSVWQLRGLVSVSQYPGTKSFCETQSFVVFTDVAKHADWIKKTAKLQLH